MGTQQSLMNEKDPVLNNTYYNRWAGSYGIDADFVAMSNCTVFGIKTEVVLVSTPNEIQTPKSLFSLGYCKQHHVYWQY